MPHEKKLTLEELQQYFHLPIVEVSKRLDVCCTVLKKICRKNGIKRWPHRKFKSLDNLITGIQEDSAVAPVTKTELDKLKRKRDLLMRNPNASARVSHLARKVGSKGFDAATGLTASGVPLSSLSVHKVGDPVKDEGSPSGSDDGGDADEEKTSAFSALKRIDAKNGPEKKSGAPGSSTAGARGSTQSGTARSSKPGQGGKLPKGSPTETMAAGTKGASLPASVPMMPPTIVFPQSSSGFPLTSAGWPTQQQLMMPKPGGLPPGYSAVSMPLPSSSTSMMPGVMSSMPGMPYSPMMMMDPQMMMQMHPAMQMQHHMQMMGAMNYQAMMAASSYAAAANNGQQGQGQGQGGGFSMPADPAAWMSQAFPPRRMPNP